MVSLWISLHLPLLHYVHSHSMQLNNQEVGSNISAPVFVLLVLVHSDNILHVLRILNLYLQFSSPLPYNILSKYNNLNGFKNENKGLYHTQQDNQTTRRKVKFSQPIYKGLGNQRDSQKWRKILIKSTIMLLSSSVVFQ